MTVLSMSNDEQRIAIRAEKTVPLFAGLENWMRLGRAKLSRHAPVSRAFDYMLTRWDGFAVFLADGRICATNNAAERALRGLALGRKSWLFAGAEHAAFMYALIVTATMNGIKFSVPFAASRSRSRVAATFFLSRAALNFFSRLIWRSCMPRSSFRRSVSPAVNRS